MGIREQIRSSRSAPGNGSDAAHLSPWPDAGADRDAAVERLSKAIGGRTKQSGGTVDTAETNALGQAAAAMVESSTRPALRSRSKTKRRFAFPVISHNLTMVRS